VASILEHTLLELKSINPNLEEAFLRSDNAGCYHCAFLLLSLPILGNRVGIKISRYDFSDAQAGKDICDRRIAAVKSHMRRFLNEGNDIHSAMDMKTAIESYGGVKGCFAAVVEIQESCQNMSKHTMTGVQAFTNFSFETTGLRVWKAYNIGPGKLFTESQLKAFGTPQGPTQLVTKKPFSQPKEQVGVYMSMASTRTRQSPVASEQASQPQDAAQCSSEEPVVCFPCTEEGCIKVYQSYHTLQKHLDLCNHLLQFVAIKLKWVRNMQTSLWELHSYVGCLHQYRSYESSM